MKYTTDPIAKTLKNARKTKGLSQRAVGKLAGVPQSHISNIEKGTVDLRVSSLIELARALDLELTLVPRKSVSAVHSIVRSSRGGSLIDSSGSSFKSTLTELQRLQKQLATITQLNPINTDLAQLQRLVRDLQRLDVPQQNLNKLREINKTFKAFTDTRNLDAFKQALRELHNLRNNIAHSPSLPLVGKVRPAYSLEEGDHAE
jgi:transcriptional regulator with XRE-family HTH domain